ncbi:MAG: DUF4153 domain-containing protein [Acidimicrobiales bacterium]
MTSVQQPPPPSGPPTTLDPGSVPPLVADRGETPIVSGVELAGLIAAGVLLEVSMRSGLDNVAATAGVLLFVVVMVLARRLEQVQARTLVLGAAALAPWLMIRSSAGLTAATITAILLLFILAAGISRVGDLTNLRTRVLALHLLSQSFEWIYGLRMVRRFARRSSGSTQWGALVRGIAIAAPVVLTFGILLASADDVFAQLLQVGNGPSLFGHVVLALLVSIGLLGIVSRAAHRTDGPVASGFSRSLSAIEVRVVLGSVAALFSAFVATQVTIALGGAKTVLETEGLTQAEHARQGFFQLLWVAALSLALIGVIRAVRRGGSAIAATSEGEGSKTGSSGADGFTVLAVIVLLLTLVITAVSIQRLVHYVDAFGLTPLRLWSLASAGGIGVVIGAYVLSVVGVRSDRAWFPGFLVAFGAIFVFGMNVANPDALVADYNLNNPGEVPVDTLKLASLSDDAIPAAYQSLSQLDGDAQTVFRAELCRRFDHEPMFGFLGFNAAEYRADDLLDKACGSRPIRTS